jgi:hypothetical protein
VSKTRNKQAINKAQMDTDIENLKNQIKSVDKTEEALAKALVFACYYI